MSSEVLNSKRPTKSGNGKTQTGDFIAFLRMYSFLEPTVRENTFVSRIGPGLFAYAVFPQKITLPPESLALIKTADVVAEIQSGTVGANDTTGTLFSAPANS